MKLVFLIDSPRKIGGGDYAQFLFAKHLACKGHEVTIFARDKNFLSDDLKNVANLTVKYYHSIPLFMKKIGIGLFNNVWSWLYAITHTKPFLRKHKPDWVIGYLRHSAIKAVWLGKKTKTPVANFIFETPPWMELELPEEWAEELKNKKFRRSWDNTKKAYAASDLLLPNSLRSGIMCKKWLKEARIAKPVYPGIDISSLPKNKGVVRMFDIVYVGRLNALKNVHEIILAAAKVKKKLSLLIIGSGEELEQLLSLADKHNVDVLFKGAVTDAEKWSLLQQSKMLVFPTSHEGFGMPPLEAIACGAQVICSHLPIFDEVYGKNIHYFPLHDVDALAKAIENVLKGKKKMPATAKKLLSKYTWDNAVKTIEQELKKHKVKP